MLKNCTCARAACTSDEEHGLYELVCFRCNRRASSGCTRSRGRSVSAACCCTAVLPVSNHITIMQFLSKQAHAVSTQCTRRCRSKRHARPGNSSQLSSLAERMQHVAAITAKLAPSRIICVCDCHTIRARTRTLALNSLRKCQTRIVVLLAACLCVIPVGCTPQ